jgi:hypothetical protein
MKLASKVAHKVASKVARKLTGSGGSSTPAFNPSSLNPLQRFLDASPTYHGPTVAGYPVITPEESYTSIAVPRSGRCWLFDGSNDFATRGARLTSGSISALTVAAWVKTSATTGIIAAENDDSINQRGWSMGLSAGGTFNAFVSADGSFAGSKSYSTTTLVNTNSWVHVAFTFAANSLVLYINGSVATVTVGNEFTVNSIFNSSAFFGIGARRLNTTPATFFGGSIKDVIIEQATWSDAEVLSLYTNHTVPAGKSPLAFYRCEEESGTTGYNSLSNSNHLTLTNITQSTFHALDTGVRYSDANESGHTVANNRLLYSQDFSNAAWPVYLSTKTTGITDPLGGTTAVSVNCNANADADLAQNVSLGSATYTLSVYARSATSKSFRLRYNNGAWIHSSDIATTTSWARYSFTFTSSVAAVAFANNVAGTSGVVEFAFAQLEVGSVATPYAGTTTTALTGTIIPRSVATPTQDVAGNPLGVTGPVAKLATAEVRCVTGDGVNAYAVSGSNIGITGAANRTVCFRAKLNSTGFQALISWGDQSATGAKFQLNAWSNNGYSLDAHFAGPAFGPGSLVDTNWHWHAVSYDGTTLRWYLDGTLIGSGNVALITVDSPVTLLAKPASLGAGDKSSACISDARIYSDVKTLAEIQAINSGTDNRTNLVAHWTCQEGPGTANTNRTIYDTVGSNNLTLVNGTVSTMWANYCPFVRSHCVEYGGNVAANGAFVPGRIGSNLDAAGNVKLLLPGEPSQYDLIYPNRWGMPSLVNIGITSSSAWAKATAVQPIATVNTKFRTTIGTKNNMFSAALTGANLTSMNGYLGMSGTYDADAIDYFARAEALGGSFDLTAVNAAYNELYVKSAISNFVAGCKSDAIWTKITEFYLLSGVTFSGVLAKLKHAGTAAITNTGPFVSGDYLAAGSGAGLKSNGSTKYLDTGLSILSVNKSSFGMHAYVSELASALSMMMGSSYTATGNSDRLYIGEAGFGNQAACGNLFPTFATTTVGHYSMETSGTTLHRRVKNGILETELNTWNNDGFQAGTFNIFRGSGAIGDDRLAWSAITTAFTVSERLAFAIRTNALMTALGANVY